MYDIIIVLWEIRRNSTVGLFLCKKYLTVFSSKTVLSPKKAIKTKTVEKVTNIWYNIFAYCRFCF